MEATSGLSPFKACNGVSHRKKSRLLENGVNDHRRNNRLENSNVFVYILPTLAAIVCYSNALDGDFVHDDLYAIRDNADVTGRSEIGDVFWNDFWGKPMSDNTSHKSYRPLTVLTFRLDYYAGGGRPWNFHLVNVVLHASVTCLFVHVLRHVVRVQDLVAATAALLFAVHPVHTEAVTGIVGRAELLSCIGVLLSLIFYARSIGYDQSDLSHVRPADFQPVYFALAVVTPGLAMLCKEHGITALGIGAALDVCLFSRLSIRRWFHSRTMNRGFWALLKRLAAIACVGVVLMMFRLWMMHGQMPAFRHEDNPASFSSSLLTRVLTFNYLLAFNVWLLLCPRVLSYDWQLGSIPLVTSFTDVRNLATLCVYVILTWAAFVSLRDVITTKADSDHDDDSNNNNTPKVTGKVSHEGRHQVLLVAMVITVLPFLPTSNLLFRVGFVVAERVLYIPSLGFCLLVGQGAAELWQKYTHRKHRQLRLCLILSATALISLLAAKTYTRNYVWTSRETLFWSGLQTLPHNAKMHYNYGNLLKDRGDSQQAAHHYREAIRLYPSQPSYHNNLGTVTNDQTEAEACYRQTLALHPYHRGALVNLGNLLINRNESTGEQLLHKALSIDPRYIDALLSLSQLELRRGRWESAERYIQRALRHRPDLPDLYNYYGVLYHRRGQYEEAVASYRRAVSLNSKFTHAMTNAALSLRQLGRDVEAELFLKRAVETGDDREAMEQLGKLYQTTGRAQQAVSIYSQMAHDAPNDTDVLLNFVRTLMDSGALRQAEQLLSHMMTSTPHNPQVLFAMGHVQQTQGQLQQALTVFEEALRWSGDNSELKAKVHFEMGNIYKDLEMYRQALQSYQTSLNTDPSLTHAHHNLGALYHILGHYEDARRHYEHVLQVEPDNQVLRQNMAKLQRAATQHRQQPDTSG